MERELQARIVVNAHLLVSVSKMMDVQPEVFCVGPLSERVGNVLAYVPAHDSTRNVRAAFCIVDRALDTATASMAKYWLSDMQNRVIDACLQLHGGYGYMREFPIARAWTDARVQRIYGGTNEIMKEIIARGLFERR